MIEFMSKTVEIVYSSFTCQSIETGEQVKKGSLHHVGTTCDSSFMLCKVDDIGREICRAYYNVVSNSIPIYLVMDNASSSSGHNTSVAKDEFVEGWKFLLTI